MMTGRPMELRSQLAFRAQFTLDVADVQPLKVFMRPGSFTTDNRLVALKVDHEVLDLVLIGTPEDLQAWGEQVIRLAECLRAEADELANGVNGERGGGR